MRHAQGVFNTDYTNLLSVWADEANLWHTDALVDTWIADCCSYDVTKLATSASKVHTNAQNCKFLGYPAII